MSNKIATGQIEESPTTVGANSVAAAGSTLDPAIVARIKEVRTRIHETFVKTRWR